MRYFMSAVILAILLSSCGSSSGDPVASPPSGESGVSANFSKLYLDSDINGGDFLSLDSGSADECSIDAFRLGVSKGFAAVLKGDISGTTAGIQLYSHLVGTTMDALIVLEQGGREKTLASWTGITTTDSETYEKVSKSAAIEDPQTAAGDILLLILTCANTDVFCEIKYGCLESFVTVPSVGSAGVDKPSPDNAPPPGGAPGGEPGVGEVSCDALGILPENITVGPFVEVSFSAYGGTPPYVWAVSGVVVGSTIDENGNYMAGGEISSEQVTVTDAGGCQTLTNVNVSVGE